MKEQADKSVARIDNALLPCMPHVLAKLLTLAEDDAAARLQALGDDPGLAARLLAAAGARGHGEAPPSLAGAVAILGLDTTATLIRNSAIQQVFSHYSNRPLAELKRHWWRAIASAHLGERLARETGYAHPDEARLAGLISAMGALALWLREGRDADNASDLADGEAGEGHSLALRLAAQLAQAWGLNPFIVDALRYRGEAVERLIDAHPLVRIVHVAAALADYLTDALPFPLDAARAFYGYDSARLDQLAEEARIAADEAAARYGIEFGTPPVPEPVPGERRRHRALFATIPSGGLDLPSDTQAKRDLAREVRDMALLESVRDKLAAGETRERCLKLAGESAQLLFGLAPPIFLLRHADGTLRPQPLPGQPTRAAELSVNPATGASVAARSAHGASLLDTVQAGGVTVFDRELAQLLGAGEVLYVPLQGGGAVLGLAAFGIEAAQASRLAKQQRLLLRYGRACADLLRGPAQRAPAAAAPAQLAALQSQLRRVVHEANNPLAIMKNYLKLLAVKLEEQPAAQADVRILNEEIDRVAALVRSLAAPAAPAAHPALDVNELIRDLVALTEPTLFAPANIAVHTVLASPLTPVVTARDKLKQILLNLLKNAAEAMPEGGTLTLATHDDVNRDGQSCVEIRLTDTGPGLPPEVLRHLFEPVASGKGSGHAGLGLAIVKALVEEIGASITCISTSSGITFQLLLPKKAVE